MRNFCFFLLVFLISCSISKESNLKKENEQLEWRIQEFKIVFFRDCIAKSYKEEKWAASDISYSHDFGLGLSNYRLIDSLTDVRVQQIQVDSINWTNKICKGCDEETLQRNWEMSMIGKRTLKFCLDYYTSAELDSIAKVNILRK